MYLSVIIPAYNEEKRLPKTLAEIDKYLSQQSYEYEIVVVSDGSKDKTSEITKELMPKIKGLRIINNKENHGKGYVVRQGLMESSGDFRLFTDADNSTSIDQIENLLPEFNKGFDVVIGSRDAKGAVLDPPQPFSRRFLGKVWRILTQIICGTWGILDTQCGFKCFTAKSVKDILPKCKIKRWAFDPEILVLAKKMKYKIKEVPITWKNDLDSKVKFSGMVKMLFELFQIRLNMLSGVYKNGK